VVRLIDLVMNTYTKLAKSAAEHFVKTGEPLPVPTLLPSELYRQRACYVSIMENPGRYLRAMAGEALPRQANLAQEIIMNTVTAMAAQPHRRIRQADLAYLSYSVALLGPLQRISDHIHLDPNRFGLYVKSLGKSALLLPRRVGVETPNDQIATALREAGIDGRRDEVTMYRFEVTYFEG